MKATIIIFGNISKGKGASISFFNYQMLTYFNQQNTISKIVCLDSDISETDNLYELTTKFSGTIFSKISFAFSVIVGKLAPFIEGRYLMEVFFDYFTTRELNLDKTDTNLIINLKATVPRCCKKAKAYGIPIVSLTTISHPKFIYDQIRKMQKLYDLRDNSPYMNKLWREFFVKGLERSDTIVFRLSSEYVRKTYENNGFDTKKLYCLKSNNGVSVNRFKKKSSYGLDGRVTFLAIGGGTLKKGIILLLDAWNQINSSYKQRMRLLIVDKDATSLKQAFSEQKLCEESILILKYTQKIEEIYQRADVFIAPTIADLGPRTVTEAMTVGLPCIVSDQCGMAEWMTNGKEGFVYPPFDRIKLVKAIEYFSQNPLTIPKMGNLAREKALSFKTSEFAAEFFELCQKHTI